jgi:hypothetical protein
MCSTMTTRTTPRTTFTVSDVQAVLVAKAPPSRSLLLTVSLTYPTLSELTTNFYTDSKQARDLLNVLKEANQQIDPRLQEMARYGGGGGGGRGYGGGRGGRGGRGGGGWTGSNNAPLGNNRRW